MRNDLEERIGPKRTTLARGLRCLLLACALIATSGWAQSSQTRLVEEGASDTGDCVAEACGSIQYALDQSGDGDTILVAPGNYVESAGSAETGDTNGLIIRANGIALIASGGAENTTIDADGATNAILIGDDA